MGKTLNIDDDILPLAEGVVLLRQYIDTAPLLAEITRIAEAAPFRHMQVPGGAEMSVAMTNCGALGWTASTSGYVYTPLDPLTNRAWPSMPNAFSELATGAADAAGFANFHPDACLINRYTAGARMGLHQDKDERDFSAPIVSVSIGAPATFLLGGLTRRDKVLRTEIHDGDVLVWGGMGDKGGRLRFHGVAPLRVDELNPFRFNLTLRKAM